MMRRLLFAAVAPLLVMDAVLVGYAFGKVMLGAW
jgi:hypothetical protein